MLTIRLQRTGARNQPQFRVVLAEAHRAAGKKVLEILGHYNPRNKELGIKNKERLDYWVAQNVSISPTVRNLLIEKKFLGGSKVKAWRPKPKEKVEEAKPEAAVKQAENVAAAKTPAEIKSEETKKEEAPAVNAAIS